MTDTDIMPFGKYRGEIMQNVPASYLLWLADQPNVKINQSELFAYIEDNRKVLEKEVEWKDDAYRGERRVK